MLTARYSFTMSMVESWLKADLRTYKHMPDWVRTFREATNRDTVCLLVGNKIDLEGQQKIVLPKGDCQHHDLQGLEHF
jgi:GTPase SAR1 family protein